MLPYLVPFSSYLTLNNVLYIDDIGKSCFVNCGHDIILYADDIIILIAPSVTELEKMLHVCENELRYIDMSINYNKRSK